MKPFTSIYSVNIRAARFVGRTAIVALVGMLALGCAGADELGDSGEPAGLSQQNGGGGLDGNGGGLDGTGGVGTPGEAVCGNGACDAGEHLFNCRDDCEAGPFLQCLQEACMDAVAACGGSPACGDALICLSHCDPAADDCAPGCAANLDEADASSFTAVSTCARDSECIPDGPPKPDDVNPNSTCEGRCGEPKLGADECACDTNCVFFGDCCTDYEAVCSDTPTCGDGICGENEDRESCPEDCEGDGGGDEHGTVHCLSEACPDEFEACAEDEGCVAVLDCIETCEAGDTDCILGCSQAGGFSMPAINLGICGQESGCFEDAPPAGPECGDGACTDGESANSCPEDCDDGGGGNGGDSDILACLAEACVTEFAACTQDAACAQVIECLTTCDPNDDGCYLGCAQQGGFSQVILDFGVCAGGSGCLTGGGGGGPVCGDGACEGGENANTCPEDCETTVVEPGEGITECLANECSSELDACLADDACIEVLACLEDCPGGDQGCLLGCAQTGGFSMPAINLGMCGQGAGCFEGGGEPEGFCGDGDCNGNENPGTCPEDCEDNGDCVQENCGDLLEDCQNTPTCVETLQCLNGCDTDACAQGCIEGASDEAMEVITEIRMCAMEYCGDGGGDPDDCVWQECGNEADACLSNDDCAELVECLQGCDTDGCVQGCAQQAGQQAIGLYQAVAACYEENCDDGGGGPGADCGNGVCENGENPGNCPEDCDDVVGPPGDAFECIIDSCNVGNQCQNSPTCSGMVACVSECDDEACAYSCTEGVNGGGANYVTNVIIPCAFESGCIGEGGGGDPGDGNEYFECLEDACDQQLTNCYTNGSQTCPATFNCIEECTSGGESVGACVQSCWEDNQGWQSGTTTALFECSAEAECHGGGGGQEPECGDGDCDDGENPNNCPEDCGGNNGEEPGEAYFECLEDECGGALNTCYTNGSQTCPATFNCVAECGEDDDADMDECVEDCWADNEGWTSGTTTTLFECSEDAGCHGGGTNVGPPGPGDSDCGNGACEDGENVINCPADCDTGNPEVDEVIECIAGECEAELEACYASDECGEVLECGLECNPDDFGCLIGCAGFGALSDPTIMGIFNCAQSSGCL